MILLLFIKTSDTETFRIQITIKVNLMVKKLKSPKKMITKFCSKIVIKFKFSKKLVRKYNKKNVLKSNNRFKNPIVKKRKMRLKKSI